jgi:predicted permease
LDFIEDAKFGFRQLRRNRVFTIAAVAALTLGIGVNTAVFTVVNAVLLKPLAYPEADRIVKFIRPSKLGNDFFTSVPEFRVYERQKNVFAEIAAYDMAGPGFNLTGERPEQIHGIHASEGYFRLFGAPVILGRTFTPQEDAPNGGRVVVLSFNLWQRKFGGDRGVLGKSLLLGSDPYTIVGVIGKQFVPEPEADIWIPFQFPLVSKDHNHFFQVAARLSPGVTLAAANAQLKLATAEYQREFSEKPGEWWFLVKPLRDSMVGDARFSLLVLLSACGLVLLIACANVANLLLARASGRKREFAIRLALGASRRRIISQLLTESVLLSLTGGALGSILGFAGVRALLAFSPAGLPRIGEGGSGVGVDWRVLAFTLVVSLATGILFGLFPALGTARANVNSSLKENGNRAGTGFREGKVRSLLVISEISLALVLLVAAALLMRTFYALHHVEPGFNAHNVLTLEMSLTGDRYHKTAGVAQLSRDGRERLAALPEVESSAAAYWLPIKVDDYLGFQIMGRPVDKQEAASRWMSISPGYMQVFGIPILRGRDFKESDIAGAPQVAMISEAMAKEFWPNEDPVGRHVLIGKGLGPEFASEGEREIVGIVGDTHNGGLGHPPEPVMIVPLAQVPDPYAAAYDDFQPLIWSVRTRGDPHQVIPAVAEQLRIASGGFTVAHVQTMDEVMQRSTVHESFNMLLLSIFGAAALLLAAIGIYGLMAYSVAQRAQEMGIRMALGADRSTIRKLVVWQGMRLALIGTIVGIAAAFGLMRLIASFLFGVKPWDPAVFVAVPVLLAGVALLAVWLPAARASKVEPMEALRAE